MGWLRRLLVRSANASVDTLIAGVFEEVKRDELATLKKQQMPKKQRDFTESLIEGLMVELLARVRARLANTG
jgi:hypothetical protein